MAKAPTTPKKTATKAKKPGTKKPAARKPAIKVAPTDGEEGKATARKRKAATPKNPVDTRVVEMRGDTRLTHHGDGADALAAVVPAIDAVNAGGRVLITSAAHGADGVNIHAVPVGHPSTYETHPGVILAIGANGLMAFDGVAVGLATANAIEETVLAVMDAVKPVEGEAATPSGRRADWHPEALLAVETLSERLRTA